MHRPFDRPAAPERPALRAAGDAMAGAAGRAPQRQHGTAGGPDAAAAGPAWARARAAAARLLSLPKDKPALLQAQYRALCRQVPLLYAILVINTWLLAFTHWGTAPYHLTLWFPLLLTVVCGVRGYHWRHAAHVVPDAADAYAALHRMNQLALVLAASFVAWSLAMYHYGNRLQQAHVAFYMAITAMGCIVCLLHVRRAMLTTALVVNGVFSAFYLSTGEPVFGAIAVNVVLVSLALLSVLLAHYRDFTMLVDAQIEAEALSAENLRLANQDSLTGLPNRRGFFAALDAACAAANGSQQRFAVAILDLDGFKPVNDLYGHVMGDRLLEQVGQRLDSMAGNGVHAARLGGDEFALIIRGLDDAAIERYGQRVCAALRVPFRVNDSTLQVGASMGLVMYPDLADTPADLYEHADYALYHGKRNNRGTVSRFSAHHSALIQQDAVLEQTLRGADLDNELSVVFQPIIDADGKHTHAFEALARWHSPRLGNVSPAHFIPVAERAGLINVHTRVLLRKALAAAAAWPAPVRLSFNLSAHDLGNPQLVAGLIELIHSSPFAAGRLDLEITETAVMHDMAQIRWATKQLRDLGCGVTLDDFGTGFSSLSQLHALPLTKIKIDRSFVSGIQDNASSLKIVKSLLSLSRDMDLGCVVEGVETAKELDTLRALGDCMVQGYFYAKPMAQADVADWLARWPAPAVSVAVAVAPAAAAAGGAPAPRR